MSDDPARNQLRGSELLPRQNGELVFAAPWESRAFGIVVALHEEDRFPWEEFRSRLIDEIGGHPGDDPSDFYRRWLDACEGLLIEAGVLDRGELASRIAAVAATEH